MKRESERVRVKRLSARVDELADYLRDLNYEENSLLLSLERVRHMRDRVVSELGMAARDVSVAKSRIAAAQDDRTERRS